MECEFHKENHVILACSDCDDQLVCSECLAEKHNSHYVKKLTTLADEILKTIRTESEKMVGIHTSLCEKKNTILKELARQEQALEQSSTDIIADKETLHTLVDKTAERILSGFEEETHKNKEFLEKEKTKIDDQLISMKYFKENLEDVIKTKNPIKIIQHCKHISFPTQEKEQILYPCTYCYQRREPSSRQLEDLFGDIPQKNSDEACCSDMDGSVVIRSHGSTPCHLAKTEDLSGNTRKHSKKYLTLLSTFQQSNFVTFILPVSRDRCWLLKTKETQITLCDRNGMVHNSVSFQHDYIEGLARFADGTVLVSSLYPNCILQVKLPGGEISTLFFTGDMQPRRLCTTSSNEIYVTLWSSGKVFLKKFSKDGKELSSVENDMHNNRVLVDAGRVRINNKEDTIAVADKISDTVKCLVLFDLDLKVKLRYLGHGRILYGDQNLNTFTSREKFHVNDMIFDVNDNIIICEARSQTVQLLSPNCGVLQILIQLDCSPWCMAQNEDGSLWIAYSDKSVKVYQ